MLSTIVGWILNISSNSLLNTVKNTLIGLADDKTKIAVAQIQAEIAARQGAKEIRIATAGFWEMRLITFLIASCFTLHLVAVTLDTVFPLHMDIPKFPAPFDQWEGAILLSFFGVQASMYAINSIVTAMMGRR